MYDPCFNEMLSLV
jgi:hypothetical protein